MGGVARGKAGWGKNEMSGGKVWEGWRDDRQEGDKKGRGMQSLVCKT